MVNGILDESINRKNGEIPHRVACLMRKVVQEIERCISTQAEYLRTQNNLFKTREEKYQSRIRVLEALANGNSGESKAGINHFDHMKMMMSPFDHIKVLGLRQSVQKSRMTELEEEVVILKEKMMAQQEHMENQEKRHQLELSNIYKLLQKAGILTQEDNGDASNSNQNTSNQFSDAR